MIPTINKNPGQRLRYALLDFLGFPMYRVGTNGSVWSRQSGAWKKLKPVWASGKNRKYLRVGLFNQNGRKGFSVAHLVLEAFVGPRPSKYDACHFPDRNPANNNLLNLRWDTRKNNLADMEVPGPKHFGSSIPSAKLTNAQVRKIWGLFRQHKTYHQIAKAVGVCRGAVANVIVGKTWKHVKSPRKRDSGGKLCDDRRGKTLGIIRYSKVTERDVVRIRKLREAGMPVRDLCVRYSISKTAVRRIVLGLSWGHVS